MVNHAVIRSETKCGSDCLGPVIGHGSVKIRRLRCAWPNVVVTAMHYKRSSHVETLR